MICSHFETDTLYTTKAQFDSDFKKYALKIEDDRINKLESKMINLEKKITDLNINMTDNFDRIQRMIENLSEKSRSSK